FAVRDTRVTVIVCLIDRVSATRQMVAIREADGFAQRIVGGPISGLVNRITPCAAWVPMPNFAAKLSPQSIGQRTQPGRQHFRDVLVSEHVAAVAFIVAVNASAESLGRHAPVYGTIVRNDCGNDQRFFASECWCSERELESG